LPTCNARSRPSSAPTATPDGARSRSCCPSRSSSGEIHFKILEAKVGRVIVEGNKFFDEANIRASAPALQPGKAPNINEIARNLRVANESPSKQATVLLRSGQEEETVDAVLRVVDEDPSKYSMTVDNTGTNETGRLRVGFGYQNGNANYQDSVLTLQFVTAPYSSYKSTGGDVSHLSLAPSGDVIILGAGYRIPIYSWGDSLDFTAGYSNVNSGTVLGLFTITGTGTVAGARYTHNFDKIGDYEHRLQISQDWRSYENRGVRAVGGTTQLTPDILAHPISATYSGVYRQQDSETGFSFGLTKNYAGLNDGLRDDFCASRNNGLSKCATPFYEIWKWSLNHNRALPADWQMRLAANGQQTRNMLVSGEQFGIGGMDSVRGFLEREIANDRGYRGTAEIYTPDFGGKTGISGARIRALGFFDIGHVERVQPGPAELHGVSIWSYGLGLRFSRGSNLAARVDLGIVGHPGGLEQTRDEARVHFSVSYVF